MTEEARPKIPYTQAKPKRFLRVKGSENKQQKPQESTWFLGFLWEAPIKKIPLQTRAQNKTHLTNVRCAV